MKRTTRREPKGSIARRRGSGSPKTGRASAAGELVVPAEMKSMIEALGGSEGLTVEKGWGSNSVALKARGKIFAMLVRGDLVFKLPRSTVDQLVQKGARRFDPRGDGREMKEWAVLPLTARDRVNLARQAFEFVSGGGK